jgi:hypothetical protein
MFSLSMFGPFQCSVFRCLVPFEVRSFDIQSFDVRSHLTFGLSMFSPIRGSVFRCSVLFDVWSFEVRSFDIQSFEVRSFEVRSFEVQSRFLRINCPIFFPGHQPFPTCCHHSSLRPIAFTHVTFFYSKQKATRALQKHFLILSICQGYWQSSEISRGVLATIEDNWYFSEVPNNFWSSAKEYWSIVEHYQRVLNNS